MDKSQIDAIENHLKTKGSITNMEAFSLYQATRLSAVIYELRRRGLMIVTHMCKGKNQYGNVISYAKYELIEEDF